MSDSIISLMKSQLLQGTVAQSWEVNQQNITAILSSSESLQDFIITYQYLSKLDDKQIILFLLSKDRFSLIKSSFQHPILPIRLASVAFYGMIYIHGWSLLNDSRNIDIEGYISIESMTELKRMKEDYYDNCIELIKTFCNEIMNIPNNSNDPSVPIDDYEIVNVYTKSLIVLFNRYLAAYDQLDEYCDQLQGLSGSSAKKLLSGHQTYKHSQSNELIEFLKIIIQKCFSDPYLLIERGCKINISYNNNSTIQLISRFIRVILYDITYNNSFISTLQTKSNQDNNSSLFSLNKNNDLSTNSRTFDQSIDVFRYVEDWIKNYLLYIINNSHDLNEVCEVIKEVICITQHHIMAALRVEV
eukprot:gene6320-8705_t